MLEPNEEYLYETVEDFLVKNINVLIIGPQKDKRTEAVFEKIGDKLKTIEIDYLYDEKLFSMRIVGDYLPIKKCEPIRIGRLLSSFTGQGVNFKNVLLDISSLQVPTIMGLLRTMLVEAYCKPAKLFTAYAKPEVYLSQEKKYMFSKKFCEASSVPGFVARAKEDEILIPLLGFEGGRLRNIIGETQFLEIRPIVGFPTDNPRWPFETMKQCMEAISEQDASGNIEKCKANSIWAAYNLLNRITRRENENYVLAPLGTKPHVVAATVFALKNSSRCRIIYDYAIENYGQSEGVHDIVITHISYFL